jgi:AcrR family transcriptional regulator
VWPDQEGETVARQDTVDPRVTRTRQVVLTAVIEELADVGHADFTIESVAARCGVGKSTIYRHWDGKLQLIIDAMHELNTQPAPEPDGTPRERIRQLLHHLGHALTAGSLAPAIPALIEPICQASIIRYTWPDDGGRSRILFSNPASETTRERMTIRLSYDEGRTWPVSKLIHRHFSAYSSLVVLPDGMIGLLYEAAEEGERYQRIDFARISLEWLTDGADRLDQ